MASMVLTRGDKASNRFLEGAVKLEAEQYLGAEHQRARFVQGSLHLAAQRHGQWFSA